MEHLPIGQASRALYVGCGTGFPLLELAGTSGRPAGRSVSIWPTPPSAGPNAGLEKGILCFRFLQKGRRR